MFIMNGIQIYRTDAELGKLHFLSTVMPRSLSPLERLSFGKCEMEDVAHRLLSLSIEARQWVGASFRDFALHEQHRLRDRIRRSMPKMGYMTRFPAFARKSGCIPIVVSGTIGAMSEISTVKGFPQSVLTGISMLEEKGMIEIVHDSREDILVPTEALILKALRQK